SFECWIQNPFGYVEIHVTVRQHFGTYVLFKRVRQRFTNLLRVLVRLFISRCPFFNRLTYTLYFFVLLQKCVEVTFYHFKQFRHDISRHLLTTLKKNVLFPASDTSTLNPVRIPYKNVIFKLVQTYFA